MTRINVVPPQELSSKHLVAEYRELPRVFALVRLAQTRGESPSSIRPPGEYTLGKGHVRFFYGKLKFLIDRQKQLIAEMIRRGYNPQFRNVEELVQGIDPVWVNDWKPDNRAKTINRQRIAERQASSGNSHQVVD